MPNWCRNTLWVNHEDKTKLDALHIAIKEGDMCKHVIPEPDYDTTPVAKAHPEVHAQFAKTEEDKAKIMANEPTIFKDSWWDWRVMNWGTKWDIDMCGEDIHVNEDGSLSMSFDSAWNAPERVYEALIELGFSIHAEWYEGGMGFGGTLDNDGRRDFNLPDGDTAVERFENMKKRCMDKEYDRFMEDWGIYEDYERDAEEEQEEKAMESTN